MSMQKKDLLFFLDDFSEDAEICFWSNGKARPVTEVKDDKSRGIILLKGE